VETDKVQVFQGGLAGRPPKNARAFLDRQRPVLVARWVKSCRRAIAHLNNPSTPIDANWIRLFNSLADRLGYARVSEQRVDATSISTSVQITPDDFVTQLRERVHLVESRSGRTLEEILGPAEERRQHD
jgi:hypothetical protein